MQIQFAAFAAFIPVTELSITIHCAGKIFNLVAAIRKDSEDGLLFFTSSAVTVIQINGSICKVCSII